MSKWRLGATSPVVIWGSGLLNDRGEPLVAQDGCRRHEWISRCFATMMAGPLELLRRRATRLNGPRSFPADSESNRRQPRPRLVARRQVDRLFEQSGAVSPWRSMARSYYLQASMNAIGGALRKSAQWSGPGSARPWGDRRGGCQRTCRKPASRRASSWAAASRW
jgi:hypothetical protein